MDTSHNADGEGSPTRRAVLRGGITTIGTSLAVSGGVAANSEAPQEVRELREKYRDTETVTGAVKRFSRSTAAVFTDTDPQIAEAVSDVNVEAVRFSESPGDDNAEEGTYFSVIERDGEFSAHITRLVRQRDIIIKHIIQPEFERSYVLFKTSDDELINVVSQNTELTTSALDTDSIDASACESQGYSCGPECCARHACDVYTKFEEFCCRGVSDGCYEEDTGDCCHPLTCC